MNTAELTLEQLQENLRRLAERMDITLWEGEDDGPLDLDEISGILIDLSNGRSGNEIADSMDLLTEFSEEEEEEQD